MRPAHLVAGEQRGSNSEGETRVVSLRGRQGFHRSKEPRFDHFAVFVNVELLARLLRLQRRLDFLAPVTDTCLQL